MSKNPDVIQMTIRLEPAFHKACLASAEELGQTLAEWIRRAMKDKLEKISNADYPSCNDAELEATIRKVVAEMIAEKKII